eukprot:s28_g2.t1
MAPRAAESTGLGMLTSKASLRADTLGWVIDELATESHRTLLLDRLESQLKAKPHISRMLFAFNASDDRKVQKAIDQEFADWRKKQENAAEALTGVIVYTQTFALHLLEGPSELIFKALGFFHSISTEVRQVESPAPGMTPRPNEKGEPPGLVSVVRVLHFTELHAVRVARTWCSMPHPGRATGGAQQPLEEGSCHEMVFSLYKKMLCLCLKVRKLLDGEQDSDGGSLLKTYKKAADELPSIDEVLASSRRPLSPLFRWCSILSCFGPFRPLCLIDDHGGRKTRDPVGCVTILCILPQTGFISGFFQVQHEFA